MQSRRFATVVTIVIVVAFFLVAIAPAFASPAPGTLPLHARLVSSAPADQATVDNVEAVVLEFNETVNPDFVAVRVAGPGGDEADGVATVDGRTVTQGLVTALAAGKHTVTYRVVSSDGHPISGTVTFTTTATAASPTPSEVAPSPSEPSATAATGSPASDAPMPSEAAGTAATDGGGPSWLVPTLGIAVLAALAVGAWRLRTSRHR